MNDETKTLIAWVAVLVLALVFCIGGYVGAKRSEAMCTQMIFGGSDGR